MAFLFQTFSLSGFSGVLYKGAGNVIGALFKYIVLSVSHRPRKKFIPEGGDDFFGSGADDLFGLFKVESR